jgi:hypothetical protein
LNGLDFLSLVLPPSGWYVGFARKTVGEKVVRRTWSFADIGALHRWCASFDVQGFDTYYACASFREQRTWDEKKQQWHFRTHDNVLWVADLWADIDTRESKPNAPYEDAQEAALAVVAFCRVAKLPLPLWVASGGGLHIHWPLISALCLDDWLLYARSLKRATQAYALQIDPARTGDASSILRLPGTHHHKTGRIVQASSAIARLDPSCFHHLQRHLTDEDRNRRISTKQAARSDSPIAAAIANELWSDASDLGAVRRHCRQIGAWAVDPGRWGEPFNRLVAGTAKNAGPGADSVYLGWLAPEWRDVGRAYFDRWETPPPWCATFESENPGGCDGCALKGEGRNPLWWGRQAERKIERLNTARISTTLSKNNETAARSTQPIESSQKGLGETPPETLPGEKAPGTESQAPSFNGFPVLSKRWGFDENNRLCEIGEDKKGSPIYLKVSEHAIYISGVHNSEVLDLCSYTFKHWLPNEGWREINIPASAMGNGRGIPELMDQGVIVHDPKRFTEYMNEQLGEFNRVPGQRRAVKYEQCGWKGFNYLVGTTLYRSDGSVLKVVTTDEIAGRTKIGLGPVSGGDARAWVSITNQLFPHDHHCAWINIGFSFGSMFMPWHSKSEGGVLISNITPESGKGKTRIAQVCAGIWGNWNALSIKDYDTAASQGLILACLCNIPGFVDELAHFARHAQFGVVHLREFIDKFAAGHDKHRALQHGMGIRHQLGSWQMILITTSNQAVTDLVDVYGNNTSGGNAPSMRILELDATPPQTFDAQLGDKLEPYIWLNAGHAGDIFLRHVIRDEVQQRARVLLENWTKWIWDQFKLGSEQRFRVRALACAAVSLTLAQECQLVPASLDVRETIMWGLDQVRSRIPAMSDRPVFDIAIDALSRFLHANVNNTLRVQYAFKAHMTQGVLGQRPQKLVIRHESVSQRVYAVQKDFRTFIVNAGFPYATVIHELTNARILRNDKRMLTLGAGTEYASVQTQCVEFDGSHPVFGSLVQEVQDDAGRSASRA